MNDAVAADEAVTPVPGNSDDEDVKRPPALGVGVSSAPFGTRLADRNGRTLYTFSLDGSRRSRCSRTCALTFPPVRSPGGKPGPGAGVRARDVGSMVLPDGSNQVTFRGHPIYYFTGDDRPGLAKGQGRSQFGGVWSAVPPAQDAAPTERGVGR